MSENLVSVENLKKYFILGEGFFKKSYIKAVDDITLNVKNHETLSIVGESGSGKSTLGKTILRLIEPTSGKIFFQGEDITFIPQKKLKVYRKDMQIVFQDPYTALNPRMKVIELIKEPLDIHRIGTQQEKRFASLEMAKMVGLKENLLEKYPNELSGGERQRVAIARALILKPKFLIADEPTSALDILTRNQILKLFLEFKEKFSLTLLFITHDMAVARTMSDKIAIMYAGNIIEYGRSEELFSNMHHPYTKLLFSSVPVPDPLTKTEIPKGYKESTEFPEEGCKFVPRCPYAKNECFKIKPPLEPIDRENHLVACLVKPFLNK